MMNTEYNKEFCFDINQYLIENYANMNMETRRTVCHWALQSIETDELEAVVDECVSYVARERLKLQKNEELETDEETDDDA